MLAALTAQLHEHPFLADLGPEPLGNALTPEHLAARFAGKRAPLKAALLDQKNIAGLGNIYVCEALSRAALAKEACRNFGHQKGFTDAKAGHADGCYP